MEENGIHFGQYCYAKYTGCCTRTGGFPTSCQTKSELMRIFQYSLATFTFIFLGEEGDFLYL